MFNTLRSRLFVSYLLVAFICLSVIACVLLALVGPLQRQLSYAKLSDRATPTALWVRELLRREESPSEIVRRAEVQLDKQQSRMLLVSRDGEILADSSDQLAGQVVRQFNVARVTPAQWPVRGQWKASAGERYSFLALPVTSLAAMRQALPDDTIFVVLATSNTPRVLLELTPFLLGAFVIGFLVSLLLAFMISRWISSPLQMVTEAAEGVAQGDYDQAVEISSPDEIRRLAESFNYMAQQVKASRDSQRDFVANVSHELKTPLTSIQGFAEAIVDGTASDTSSLRHAGQIIRDEAARMARLVEELLALAKISGDRDRTCWTEVDIAALLPACVERLTLSARERNVGLRMDLGAIPPVRGNPDRLAQVFTNLLDNAIKHSPPGSEIVVSAKTGPGPASRQEKKWIEIGIADSGPGIPPEDVPRVFERFYQVDKSRAGREGGAGLGLAIVHEIVDAHNGHIRAENRPGPGALFTVLFPEA